MADPIRWDNVNGRSLSEAAVPLMQASQSFNNAFAGLQDQVHQGEAIDANNALVTRKNNTTDFLNGLFSKYTNADAMKQAIDSGDVAKTLASYGHNIDADAVRGAADARLQALQQQATQNIAYQHAMTDERVAPLMDQYKTAALKGDTAAMADAQSKYQQLGGRDLAGLVSFADQRNQQLKERGYLDANQALGIRKGNAEITHMANQDRISQGQLGVMQGQLGLAQKQFGLNLEEHLATRQAALRQEMGALYAQDPTSPQGQQAIFDEIAKNVKDPGDVSNRQRAALAIIKANPNATVGDVTAAVLGMDTTHWYKPDAFARWGAEGDASQLAGRSSSLGLRQSVEMRKGMVANDLSTVAPQLAAARASLFSNLAGTQPAGAPGFGGPSFPAARPPGSWIGTDGHGNSVIMNPPAPGTPPAYTVEQARQDILKSQQPGTWGAHGFIPAGTAPAPAAAPATPAGNMPAWANDSLSQKADAARAARAQLLQASQAQQQAQAQQAQAAAKAARAEQLQQQITKIQSTLKANNYRDAPLLQDLKQELAGLSR